MRIIGGRDYYDGVMAYGQDDALFVRTPYGQAEAVPANDTPLRVPRMHQRLRYHLPHYTEGQLDVIPWAVWLADNRFAGLALVRTKDPSDHRLFWDKTSFHAALEEKLPPSRRLFGYQGFKKAINDAFATDTHSAEIGWLVDNRIAVAIGTVPLGEREFTWRLNTDGLKDLQFAKLMDPYTAYQELSQWVRGVLPNLEADTVSLSDEDKIAKRGFDEWSFRKPPEKRRQKT